MQIYKNRIETALISLYEEGIDSYYLGKFSHVLANINAAAFQYPAGLSTKINIQQLKTRLFIINMDLLNIASISRRLVWQQVLRTAKQYNLGDSLWRFYASADIELFFIKYRSIFDNIAQVIKTTAKTPRSVPESFNDLKTWLAKSQNRSQIQEKFVKLVISCDWFNDIKNIRDSIEHHAAETVTGDDKERILFQVKTLDGEKKIDIHQLMADDYFLDFELYAGVYGGYLISYLEDLSGLIYKELIPDELDEQSKNYHPGFGTIRDWLTYVIKKL
jgi:hypothetical protein